MPRKSSAAKTQNLTPQSTAIVRVGDANSRGANQKHLPVKKEPATRIPRPQVLRIQARHIAGESNREIARNEGRDRGTISRIVKSTEMSAFVEEMKERYRGLAPLAIDAIEHSLRVQKDGKLAHQTLADVGVAPLKGEQEQLPSMTPEEGYRRQVELVANALLEANEMFNVPLPEGIAEKLQMEKVK